MDKKNISTGCLDQHGLTAFDLRAIVQENLTTCEPLQTKWCIKQQIHKI